MAFDLTPTLGSSVPTTKIIQTVWGGSGISPPSYSFFKPLDIDGARWNKLYPYQLCVVKSNNSNKNGLPVYNIVEGSNSPPQITQQSWWSPKAANSGGAEEGDVEPQKFTLSFKTNADTKWVFDLPITPEQLQITNVYASKVTATLKGIVEENAGIRFKMINMSGSMGTWTQRTQISTGLPTSNLIGGAVQTAAGSTINALSAIIDNATALYNETVYGYPLSRPTLVDPSDGDAEKSWASQASDWIQNNPLLDATGKKGPGNIGGYYGTGYVNALLLDQFLEQYAEQKTKPENSSWRLALNIPKQNQAFLVTPQQFVWNQSADAPTEIKYSLSLKAWRRVVINGFPNFGNPNALPKLTQNALQRVLNAIALAQRLIASIINLAQALKYDLELPLRILKAVAQLFKSFYGIGIAFNDMAKGLHIDYKQKFLDFFHNTPVDTYGFQDPSSFQAIALINKAATQNLENPSSTAPASSNSSLNNPTPPSAYQDPYSLHLAQTNPVTQIFENPDKYPELFSKVPINALALTPQQQARIYSTLVDTKNITVTQLRIYRSQILNFALFLENLYGLGSAFYNNFYNVNLTNSEYTTPTVNNFLLIKSLYDVIQTIDNLTSSTTIDDTRILTAMQYVGGIANANNITFDQSISKYLVPVPYGYTMEQIANTYLGDPDRWLEIVVLNGLQSPYIDETGFYVPLLSNATGRQFTIGSINNIVVGQTILLSSNVQTTISLQIISIEEINSSTYLITVGGDVDISGYTTVDNAQIKAFLPNTINSTCQIYVPYNTAPDNTTDSPPIPALSSVELVGLSKVDWLLTSDYDVAIDTHGDTVMSAGITNLIQALTLILLTPKGTVIKAPQSGGAIQPGGSVADTSAAALFQQIQQSILADGRFNGIQNLQITVAPPVIQIYLEVSYSQGIVLPISFSVPAPAGATSGN